MYTYHCHNTKHVHVPLSQYKTCRRTTVTIQNMYMYHCHNTKHVHVPLSQYKTCTRTTVTTQNMYTYHCHNTKHVHIPLSQYKICTHTSHNTKHVHVRLTYLLSPWSTVLLVKLTGFQLVKKYLHFIEPEGILPHSHVPASCPNLS